MSLEHSSDDSLARIMHFLSVNEILRLATTGSKQLIARLTRSTEELVCHFAAPNVFPFSVYRFTQLRSLTISSEFYIMDGHLTLQGRSILPPEPMPALESLKLEFHLAHRILDPNAPKAGLSLAELCPKLTSLTIKGLLSNLLVDGWAETLPKSLTFLKLSPSTRKIGHIHPSFFESLPNGLQHLEIVGELPLGAGPVNLRRFEDLRVLIISRVHDWDILQSLPDLLDKLHLEMPRSSEKNEIATIFKVSKLPPKIRVLNLSGAPLAFEYDFPFPSTLEKLFLGDGIQPLGATELEKYFATENLRKLCLKKLASPPKDLKTVFDMLTNLEEFHFGAKWFDINRIPSNATLPRSLKKLMLSSNASGCISLKDLPPCLEELRISGNIDVNELAGLPQKIKFFFVINADGTKRRAHDVWSALPPKLTYLDAPLSMMKTKECLHGLPKTLESLFLTMDDCKWIDRLTFPASMRNNLENLYIDAISDFDQSVLRKTQNFKFLQVLKSVGIVRLRDSTLSYLPRSLTTLEFQRVKLVNGGRPSGTDWKRINWQKDGAFSRLPEGLRCLSLNFELGYDEVLDMRHFSNLPKGLVMLHLEPNTYYTNGPKIITRAFPKRIAFLTIDGRRCGDPSEIKKVKMAIATYYASEPLWDDFHEL